MNKIVLGIDQSYGGFAMVAWGVHMPMDEWKIYTKAWSARLYGVGVDRLAVIDHEFAFMLQEARALGEIVHVCMEGYSYGAINGREQAGELGGVIKLNLVQELPAPIGYPTIVSPSQVKKFATSSGASKKNEMLKAVYRKWGADCKDDNAADAYTLARIAASIGGLELPGHEYERDVIKRLKPHSERRE